MHSAEEIQNAFSALLLEKPYSSITIQDICTRAGLSRKTFSKFFYDKDEVVCRQINDDFIAPPRKVRAVLPLHDIKSSTQLMLECTFLMLFEKKEYYLALIKGVGMMRFVELYAEQSYAYNKEIYPSMIDSTEQLDFVAHFFASTQAMTMKWWIENDFNPAPKQMAKLYNTWGFSHWRELLAMKNEG